MIDVSTDDQKTLAKLGYVVEEKTGAVAGDWDHLTLYDAPTYAGAAKKKPVGMVTRRAGGGYLCTLTFPVFERVGDEWTRPTKVTVGRSGFVGSAVKLAHDDRVAITTERIKDHEAWARERADERSASTRRVGTAST